MLTMRLCGTNWSRGTRCGEGEDQGGTAQRQEPTRSEERYRAIARLSSRLTGPRSRGDGASRAPRLAGRPEGVFSLRDERKRDEETHDGGNQQDQSLGAIRPC
jgi:hypothetical protein